MLLSQFVLSEDVYQLVRVYYFTPGELSSIASTGVPLDHVRHKRGVYIELAASQSEVTELQSLGLTVEVMEPNLLHFYQSRLERRPRRYQDFKLGSMGGNYTLAELEAELDTLHLLYPDLVSEKMSIGKSLEGRDIWAVKVSDNVDVDENVSDEIEPRVLYTALTHAREPISMMNLIYFIRYMCENFGLKKLPTELLQTREMWFILCVNPDGYVYNESIAPNGGGMHRKNRRDTGCDSGTAHGVDLNRNYGYSWGTNNEGSSPDPCANTYRGDAAFSEPETAVVRDFMASMDFRNVLHYHTYTNLLIHPYGDGSYPDEPDFSTFKEIGADMTRFNQYHVGTGIETVGYTVNGDAVDYSYVEEGMIAFTPEVGDWEDGFWPAVDRVGPLCEENLWPNMVFARAAGTVLSAQMTLPNGNYFMPGGALDVEASFKNEGLRRSRGGVAARVTSLNGAVEIGDSFLWNLGTVKEREQLADSVNIPLTVASGASGGCTGGLVFHFDDGYETTTDTIQLIIGKPETVFAEDGEANMSKWKTSGWGISGTAHTGSGSISDSPSGKYSPQQTTVLTLRDPVDLSNVSHPWLEFWAKWDIEKNYDGVTIEARADDGSWKSLRGRYTQKATGGGNGQPRGTFVYEGTQTEWVEEYIDLSHLVGSDEVSFRFVLRADEGVEGNGFSFDDLRLLAYPETELSAADINGDCLVDVADVLQLVDLIIWPGGGTDALRARGDMNNDSQLNVLDIVRLVDLVLGI